MGKTKGVKVRDLNPARNKPYGVYSRFEEYFNLLMNAVKIERKNGEAMGYAEETFAKRELLEGGAVGYDKITDKWYQVHGNGVNDYGNPVTLRLVTANGKGFTRVASYENIEDGAYKIDALPSCMSLASMIRETTSFMAECDVAIRQNVEACKTPYIVVCKNDELRLSYMQALQQKQQGQAVILVNEDLGDGLKAVNIGVEALFHDFAEIRDTESDKLLNKLGIMTANTDKKERVQGAEVNATIGQCSDYVYMLIDTFNKQCEHYGIDYVMSFNGSLEELYNFEEDVANTENATNDKEGNINDQ